MGLIQMAANDVRRILRRSPGGVRAADATAVAGPPDKGDGGTAILTKFIPTETVTIYVAALAALPALKTLAPALTATHVYWVSGLVLTPVILMLIVFGERVAAKLPWFPPMADWPYFKLFAAVSAFLAWGLAVPTGPYLQGETLGVISGSLALIVSTLLSLLEKAFSPEP